MELEFAYGDAFSAFKAGADGGEHGAQSGFQDQ
jgi:hypothetical protein